MEKLNAWDKWLEAKTPKKKRKHNYPKNRKSGVHKNSQKYHLLQEHPESFIKETWIKHGIYQAGEILDASPKVIWHLAREKGWKRPLPDFLALAAQTGNWKITENYYIEEEKDENILG
ncbi:MAG: hypothetical protein D8M58_21695 [Calditrichaeota bacterium]|nr:MAG: hypothetical protein DWQ03_00780 [Calditrichota bacterium]MBL1208029.1 hypothetical protein [Calditrichota bacterium]NOG47864.1 hypothetical protein [Calditrichota bacterium]